MREIYAEGDKIPDHSFIFHINEYMLNRKGC